MGKVIAHPTMQGRPIPDRLVRDVLAGRCRSDWTAHEYLVAARELDHYGVVEVPGLYEAQTVQEMVLERTVIEGNGRTWLVRRVKGGLVG